MTTGESQLPEVLFYWYSSLCLTSVLFDRRRAGRVLPKGRTPTRPRHLRFSHPSPFTLRLILHLHLAKPHPSSIALPPFNPRRLPLSSDTGDPCRRGNVPQHSRNSPKRIRCVGGPGRKGRDRRGGSMGSGERVQESRDEDSVTRYSRAVPAVGKLG